MYSGCILIRAHIMIITDTTSTPVVSNVAAAPSRFKIKASAKAFKILSGFYSEPILAIPRELGANAWDSHVKARNTNKMFEVHAPNTLEPWFAIRDFGTGLSPEDIDTIYTTYFESTKTTDNDSDGCMGLGSKTPFNYTDNFNVTSFYNGKKHVYNCFIDETGSPNIMQIASVDTTEHSGLEIKFGVKIADISMWIDKISRAYEPFRYRPIIKGANIKYPERKYIYQGTGWAMRENRDHTHVSYAFMGNYCYPISSTIIANMLYKNDGDHKYASLTHYGNFDFFFDIGDLEVAPNKEQLQYDDTSNKTANAIIAALKIARNELEAAVKKNIEIPNTRWEAMGMYLKYNSHNSAHHAVRSILGDIPIYFNGVKVDAGGFSFSSSFNTANLLVDKKNEPHVFDVLHLEGRVVQKFKRTSTLYTSIDKEVLVYYTNEASIKKARVMHHIRSNGFMEKRNIFVFIDTSSGAKNVHALTNHFGWSKSQVINIESLPKPPPTPREKKTAATNEVHTCALAQMSYYINASKNSRYSVPRLGWTHTPATFNGAETYYYVDFLYNDPVWNNNPIGNEQLTEIVHMFVKANLHGTADQIYGINKKNQHLLKVGNWVNIIDLVKSKVIDTNKSQYENYVYMVNEFEKFKTCSYLHNKLYVNKDIIRGVKSDATKKLLSDFVETYNFLSNNANSACSDIMRLFNVSAVCHIALNCDLNKFNETVTKKYMKVLELGTGYGETASIYYNIINYVDEKS